MKPGCKTEIFRKLKKAIIKTRKSSNKGVKTKHKGNVATLNKENMFISRRELIRGSRDVDMKDVISHHELIPVIHRLMKRHSTLLDDWEGESDLVWNEALTIV